MWARALLGRPWLQLALLYLLVLGAGLPLLGRNLRHSRYFRGGSLLSRLTDRALESSLSRAREAERYFREEPAPSPGESDPRDGGRPELAVAIVTTARRYGSEHRYFLQVAAAYHRLLGRCPWCRGARLFSCNVHHPPGAHELPGLAARLVPEVRRFEGASPGPEGDPFEKEKADYLFCLSRALEASPRYVLLAEDDGLPHPDLFPVLRDVLGRRLSGRDPLYVKLYHPERLQGYLHPEAARIAEWVGLGALGGSLLAGLRWALTGRRSLAFSFALGLLCMLAAEMAGRTYLLEARRISPQFYALAPASHCCTPAMVFPARGARRTAAYLGAAVCRPGFAKDTALYEAARERGEEAYVVEPNLVSHIGLYSTLRGDMGRPRL